MKIPKNLWSSHDIERKKALIKIKNILKNNTHYKAFYLELNFTSDFSE